MTVPSDRPASERPSQAKSFTVTFRTAGGPPPTVADVASWLEERGEPWVEDGPRTLALRALPVRILTPVAPPPVEPGSRELPSWPPGEPRALVAHLDPTTVTPLIRLVDTVFHVAMRCGADVQLTGTGAVHRSTLWVVLAEEQDRARVAGALRRAREHGNADEVHKRMWAVLQSLRPGTDCRWDATLERVVELVDVGEQISVDEARFIEEDAKTGDVVQVPVTGLVHVMLWRWLSEAWPGLCEHDHSMH